MKKSDKFWLITLIVVFISVQFLPIVRKFELYLLIGSLCAYLFVAILAFIGDPTEETNKNWNIFHFIVFYIIAPPIKKFNNWLDK